LESHHGILEVNSAGRTEWEQQELIDRWDEGGASNRPPFLYEPKRPRRASSHVADGGIAVDINAPDIPAMLAHGEDYGFYRRYEWDKPHFEFDPKRVKIRAGGNKAPKPTVKDKVDDEMKFLYVDDDGAGKPFWTLLNTVTGKFLPPIYDQKKANGWATVWGNARVVKRQEFLNAIHAIRSTL